MQYQLELIEELRVRVIALEARVNALEADRDNEETYRMEQNERRNG